MLFKFSLLVLLIGILSGCVAPRPAAPRLVPLNTEEYARYRGTGTAVIYGEAFLRTRGGNVKKGTGSKVFMNPVTTYSTEWFERQVIGGQLLEAADERARPYLRETIADSDGRFEFIDLPAGDYYLVSPIFWEVPQQNTFNPADVYMTDTGGFAHTRVTVAPGERKRVVVTR